MLKLKKNFFFCYKKKNNNKIKTEKIVMPLNFIEAKVPHNNEKNPKVFNENLLINLIKSAKIKTNTGKYKASS